MAFYRYSNTQIFKPIKHNPSNIIYLHHHYYMIKLSKVRLEVSHKLKLLPSSYLLIKYIPNTPIEVGTYLSAYLIMYISTIFKPGNCRLQAGVHLVSYNCFVRECLYSCVLVCVCVCVCVCVSALKVFNN